MTRISYLSSLLGATSLGFGVLAGSASLAQEDVNCDTFFDTALLDCAQANAGTTVEMPITPQTEPEGRPNVNSDGFAISLDGTAITSDPTIEDRVRRTDLALEQANIQVVFDGFEPEARLAVETVGRPRAYSAGETVTLQSESNYPAFIERAEFRVIDLGAVGGPKLLGTVPVAVNGRASVTVPGGDNIVVVHRVYDARGRFDETESLALGVADARGLHGDVEELAQTTAVRNIRVKGGAVTVSATDMTAGSRLVALGTSAGPDGSGGAVIQRILPPGDYPVDVRVDGPGRAVRLRRDIDVPGAEWFYVAVADLTYEWVKEGGTTDNRTVGRLQYYVDGETADGVQITSSLDTGEEELRDIFRRLDEKDPRSVLERLDPEDTFPTFGDDSEIRDATPTSGKFYLRIEQDGNYALWGDYQASVAGSHFVRNERTLYGAQGVYESQERVSNGDARFAAELYASQPDQLVGRESFRGTGGTVYFLRQQDITAGTETLSVEIRDAVTGRVVDRERLVAGRDYVLNPLQGVITLARPLTGSTNNNLIQTNPGGDQVVNLVAQYEFTPTTSDVDGFSYGGRVEAWVDDNLRLGLTATKDDTGGADQRSTAVDLRYELSANSFVQLDVAKSEGPGFGSSSSLDGGLTIATTGAAAGEGTAYRLAGQADLRDLGYGRDGIAGGYYEKREAGFSTLDYQVTAATGDETLYGAFARVEKADGLLGWAIYADLYENGAGDDRTEVGAELAGDLNAQLSYELGVEYLDQTTAGVNGSRTALAARVEFEASSDLTFAAFVQGSAGSDGLDDYNRYGVGIERAIGENWAVEAEVSGGTGGLGARLLANYTEGANTTYFGYELDAGRAVDAGLPRSQNGGKYVAGGRRQVSDRTAVYGENTYDIFDERRTLTSAYGLEYVQSDYLAYDLALEIGRVIGDGSDDLDRRAISFGARYDDVDLTAAARIELRQDEAADGSSASDLDAIYFDADAEYKIDEDQRLVFNFSAADADSDESSVLDGRYVDASIGYAFRPVDNERLNVLTRYRYLHDTFGQEVDGVDAARARQESHVFSVEANYDLSRQWTLGGKLGGRLSRTSASDSDPWVDNDALLAVINARYNLVHNWDVLLEARSLDLQDAGLSDAGVLGAVYRHIGNNAKIGVGYNFSTFSDDLTDLSRDDQGAFINIIAKF